MSYFKGRLELSDGSPVIPPGEPHNCFFRSGWNRPYSHHTVAILLLNETGEIAAVVKRRPDEPDEGGKLALPGGYVERGQRVIDAAEAEVLEETGHLVLSETLGRFALLDGPASVPGRKNERNGNIVTVFTARAGEKVREHDDEVTGVLWIGRDSLPRPGEVGFGHFAIMGMWFRHLERPFRSLPIVPSEMTPAELNPRELFPASWPADS